MAFNPKINYLVTSGLGLKCAVCVSVIVCVINWVQAAIDRVISQIDRVIVIGLKQNAMSSLTKFWIMISFFS